MTNYMLGIDIGTTSTKAVLFSEKGEVIQQENIGYPLYTPDIATAEQNPEEIFQAVLQATSNIMKDHSQKSYRSFHLAVPCIVSLQWMNMTAHLHLVSLGQIIEVKHGHIK